MSDEVGVGQVLSDEAIEYADRHIGKDVDVTAIVVPPIPRDRVEEYTDDPDSVVLRNDLRSHLYDLTDIALAVNHTGDVIMDSSVEDDDPPYTITQDSVREIKVARGALISSFNRELAACAERLDIDPDEHDDLVNAIRGELGYSVDVGVDEEWTELDDE